MSIRLFVKLSVLIFLTAAGSSESQSVHPDETFGNRGTVTTAINLDRSNSEALTVKFQSDGKIVAGGFYYNESNHYNFAVVRYNPDGSLDNSFGTNGVATIPGINTTAEVNSILIQVDPANENLEKIIAAGFMFDNNDSDFVLVRFNPDGSADSSFGSNGNGIVTSGIRNLADFASSAALQNDGKIVIAGYQYNGHDYDFMVARFTADGIPDNSFGRGNGIVTTEVSGKSTDDRAYAVIIQNDGDIVAAGSSDEENSFAAVRYRSDGSPDDSFGIGGIVLTVVGSGAFVNNIAFTAAIQDDDKIILGGRSLNENINDITMIRYKSNGEPDSTFGSNGIVITDLQNNADIRSVFPYRSEAGDEKILTAGSYFNGVDVDIVLAGYNSDGSPDRAFGTGGIVIIPGARSNQTAFAADYQVDPAAGNIIRIVTAGYFYDGVSIYFSLESIGGNGIIDGSFGKDGIVNTPVENSRSFLKAVAVQRTENNEEKIIAAGFSENDTDLFNAIVRYNTDGSPDSTFGTGGDGIVLTRIENYEAVRSLNVQSNGKILATGYSAITRYNRDGIIDSLFGFEGTVQLPVTAAAETNHFTAVRDDGEIIIAGAFFDGRNFDYALVSYDSSGSPNKSFGTRGDGIAVTPIGTTDDFAKSLAIQDDGKIITAGNYLDSRGISAIAVVRYTPDGIPDNTFGEGGIVKISVGSDNDFVYSVIIQDDGKIIVTGSSIVVDNLDFTLVRLNPDGSIDTAFGTDGIVITPVGTNDDIAVAAALQTSQGKDDKIIAAGFTFLNGNEEYVLVRYNLDGSPDNTFGTNGIITGHTGSSGSTASSVLIQNDGKIVLGGTSASRTSDYTVFHLVRYIADIATQADEGSSGNTVNGFELAQNYPNPFNSQTRINYTVPSSVIGTGSGENSVRSALLVQLKIYNVLGEEVATLVNKEQQPGNHQISFNAGLLPSGVYFYKLKAGDFQMVKKMLLLK